MADMASSVRAALSFTARWTLRSLRRSPFFTLIAVLTLAFGISALTTVMAFVQGVLLNPLPYPDSDRLVRFLAIDTRRPTSRYQISAPDFEDLRRELTGLVQIAAYKVRESNLGTEDATARPLVCATGSDFVPALGVPPAMGRRLLEEDIDGKQRVAVISHSLWKRLGGGQDLGDRTILLDDRSYRVIGVMPSGFRARFPFNREVDVWVPVELYEQEWAHRRDAYTLWAFGRLAPGVSTERLQAGIDSVLGAHSDQNRVRIVALPYLQTIVEDYRTSLLVLLTIVALVMLAVCANLANLLLARGVNRQQEIAVARGLGAGKASVLFRFFLESGILAVCGSVLGVLLAFLAVPAMVSLSPPNLPRLEEVAVTWGLLGWVIPVAAAIVLLLGTLPALIFARVQVTSLLNDAARNPFQVARLGTLQNGLGVIQVGLACLLAIASGLLVRNYWNLTHIDIGFDAGSQLTLQTVLSKVRYSTGAKKTAFLHEVNRRLEALPGVVDTGAAGILTFTSFIRVLSGFEVEGLEGGDRDDESRAYFTGVDAGYFKVMGIPLIRGRPFTETDKATSQPVAIIDQVLAAQLFDENETLGRRIRCFDRSWTIVGVAGNVRVNSPTQSPHPTLYFPFDQYPESRINWVLRTSIPAEALVPRIRAEIREVDPLQPVQAVRTLHDYYWESLAEERLQSLLVGVFGVAALLLSLLGVYALVHYQVNSRTGEIGVRMALGAGSGNIFGLFLLRSLFVSAIGLVLGNGAAVGFSRVLSGFLFELDPLDPQTLVAVNLLVLLCALSTSAVPAGRAAKVDPLSALRSL